MRAHWRRWVRGSDGSIVRSVVHALILVMAFFPRLAEAQREAHFEALKVPPETAGHCMPAPVTEPSGSLVLDRKHLVMKSLEPGSSREIFVFSDRNRRTATYNDRVSVSTMNRPIRVESIMITASLLPDGSVAGSRTETVVTVPDSVLDAGGAAVMRTILEHRNSTQTTRPLDTAEQRRVMEVIDFMRTRCP